MIKKYMYIYLYENLHIFFNKKIGVMHFGLFTLDLNFTDCNNTVACAFYYFVFIYACFLYGSFLVVRQEEATSKNKKQNSASLSKDMMQCIQVHFSLDVIGAIRILQRNSYNFMLISTACATCTVEGISLE